MIWSPLPQNGETVRAGKQSSFELEGHPTNGSEICLSYDQPRTRAATHSTDLKPARSKKTLKGGIHRLFRGKRKCGGSEWPSRYKQLYGEPNKRLLSRALKLSVQPGQSLFGALVLENSIKGPGRLHRTNLETWPSGIAKHRNG